MKSVKLSRVALCVVALGIAGSALAQGNFPYDSELVLDVDPMRGSKKIPNMDITANGKMVLEMWCNRVEGQVIVAGDTVTVLTGTPTTRSCPPERERGDAELLAALTGVTNWRRQENIVVFVGPKTLRFRTLTN